MHDEIDKITGDGPGSVNARIETARETIQAQINAISSFEAYDPETAYLAEDETLVLYDGKIYQCTADTAGNLPTDTDYWILVGDYSSISEIVGANFAAIHAINFIDATSTSASAVQLASITAQILDPETGLAQAFAEILLEREARANADEALASITTTLDVSYNDPDDGLSTIILDLVASHASVLQEVSAWATAVEAGVQQTLLLSSEIGTSQAAIESIQGTLVDENGVYAWDTTVLETTVGNLNTSIETSAKSIEGIQGKYTVKIDNNGYITGYGLISDWNNGEPTSEFMILADKFSIVTPGVNPKRPFTVGIVDGVSTVGINGQLVIDGSITASKIRAGAITADKIAAGAITADKIAVGAITAEKISVGTITADRIVAGTITADSAIIAGNAVLTGNILDHAVTISGFGSAYASSVNVVLTLDVACAVFMMGSLVQTNVSLISLSCGPVGGSLTTLWSDTPVKYTLASVGWSVALNPGSYNFQISSSDPENNHGTSLYVLVTKK